MNAFDHASVQGLTPEESDEIIEAVILVSLRHFLDVDGRSRLDLLTFCE